MATKTTKKSKMKAGDMTAMSKKKVEDAILVILDEGIVIPWKNPIFFHGMDTAFKGKNYNGINCFITELYRSVKGYTSRVWITKTKLQALNGKIWNKSKKRWETVKKNSTDKAPFYHIKKGEHPIPAIFWKWIDKKDENGEPVLDEAGNIMQWPLLVTYPIYNLKQIAGLDDTDEFEPPHKDSGISVSSCQEILDRALASYANHPKVVIGGDVACYRPGLDQISIPDPRTFTDIIEFAAVLYHELGHSTGHKSRLNRPILNWHGDEKYGFEELVAEFTSAMCLERLGIYEMPVIENAAAYIKSWSTVIKNHPGALFDAITAARKATAMIFGDEEADSAEDDSKNIMPAPDTIDTPKAVAAAN